MKVAIVHYHAKPGGVTRVMANAQAALKMQGIETCILVGEASEGHGMERVAEVPALRYTATDERPGNEALLAQLKVTAVATLKGEPDIWHIHNHSLGKNNAMPDAVRLLAAGGARVLLQMHDFAEDGRPQNYKTLTRHLDAPDSLYPMAAHVHYSVLNGRDYALLRKAGFPEGTLHLLPNPISIPAIDTSETLPAIPELNMQDLTLYPTRAIRRKNLGEFILWAALEPERGYATTLAPANPQARPVYERWVAFAKENSIRVCFGLGEREGVTFPAVMNAATRIMTTSVAEGFGLAFLEPYLFGKELVGRDLPDISKDFKDDGVRLDALYDRLLVPLDWVAETVFRERVGTAMQTALKAYGRSCTDDLVARACAASIVEGRVDFGRLDEHMQERVIRKVLEGGASEVQAAGAAEPPADCVSRNAEVIKQHYSLEQYGERLSQIYKQVEASSPEPLSAHNPDALLDVFLEPERFFLLRT